MRLMDIMLALPSLLLAVAVVAILGPGLAQRDVRDRDRDAAAFVRLTRAAVIGELREGLRQSVADRRRRHRCG